MKALSYSIRLTLKEPRTLSLRGSCSPRRAPVFNLRRIDHQLPLGSKSFISIMTLVMKTLFGLALWSSSSHAWIVAPAGRSILSTARLTSQAQYQSAWRSVSSPERLRFVPGTLRVQIEGFPTVPRGCIFAFSKLVVVSFELYLALPVGRMISCSVNTIVYFSCTSGLV